ncbi:embryonic protein UVS.2-like [Bufo bufo]|uniref:embryonic protein UVS.2-like n=1 Tax=Bufo bufo TaxID=8384 RepID=UPI001ABEE014|nr:embryonic protein UVS.2-like [Bufo bufo]
MLNSRELEHRRLSHVIADPSLTASQESVPRQMRMAKQRDIVLEIAWILRNPVNLFNKPCREHVLFPLQVQISHVTAIVADHLAQLESARSWTLPWGEKCYTEVTHTDLEAAELILALACFGPNESTVSVASPDPKTDMGLAVLCKLSIPGLKEYDTDSKASEEPEGTFAKIIKVNKENDINLHQGDMLETTGRSATSCTGCLWPKSANGTVNVPYSFASNYSIGNLNLFKTSMEEFETLTCVRFVPRTTENDYLNIMTSNGCASYVGRIGGGQMVALDMGGCMYRGIIQHELNHALGFYHEHTRSDRDNYVTIMYQYIAPGHVMNFYKQNTNNLGLEYDYKSVMHYDSFAFSNTSGQPTIVTIPVPNIPIGQIDGLSVLDVSKINRLYQCNACAYLLNEKNGSLTSANYPSAYPNNASCVWLIRTPSDQVTLNFVAFDVQSSPNCISDYIRIYDGPTKKDSLLLDRTCGTGLIPQIIASTNQLLVEFSSDSSVAGVGFKATYSSVQCGGAFYAPERNFTSPGYPNSYGPNMNCIYTITAPVGKKISFMVTDFQTESSQYCLYDYLEILDGSTWKGPFCGNYKIPSFTSKGNSLWLRFVSDGRDQFRGFQASYKFGEYYSLVFIFS